MCGHMWIVSLRADWLGFLPIESMLILLRGVLFSIGVRHNAEARWMIEFLLVITARSGHTVIELVTDLLGIRASQDGLGQTSLELTVDVVGPDAR